MIQTCVQLLPSVPRGYSKEAMKRDNTPAEEMENEMTKTLLRLLANVVFGCREAQVEML